jgi:hypothetical protein
MTMLDQIKARIERWKDAPEWAQGCWILEDTGEVAGWSDKIPGAPFCEGADPEPRPTTDEIALVEMLVKVERTAEGWIKSEESFRTGCDTRTGSGSAPALLNGIDCAEEIAAILKQAEQQSAEVSDG